MGNGFHHHHQNHHPRPPHHHESFYSNNKNTFLPFLCRLSIRDVRLGDYRDRSASSPSSSSLSEDPSSPKVSCMGHVKKNHHQFIDFSTPYRLTGTTAAAAGTTTSSTAMVGGGIKVPKPSSNRGPFKYSKLKRFFSGKNILTTTAAGPVTATTSAAAGSRVGRSRSCREIVMRRSGSKRSSKINNDDGGDHHHHHDLNISDLDPPLPVPKKPPQPPSENNNLWKRRSGGMTLRSLQIDQIHAPNSMNKNNMLHDDRTAATTV